MSRPEGTKCPVRPEAQRVGAALLLRVSYGRGDPERRGTFPMRVQLVFAVFLACCVSLASCAAREGAPGPESSSPVSEIFVSQTQNGWGGGEAFELTLRADGTASLVEFPTAAEVSRGDGEKKAFTGTIEGSRFDELAALLDEKGFFEMKRRYDSALTDQAVITVAAVRGEDRSSVVDPGGAAPEAFYEIVAAVNRERERIEWTGT